MNEWKKTAKAPWDYERNTGVAKFDATCPNCGAECYGGDALPDGGVLYSCPNCRIIKLTEAQAAFLAIYDENPRGCDDVDLNTEAADIAAWLDDGFGFNDPAGAALAELAQSERNHEAVDASRPV